MKEIKMKLEEVPIDKIDISEGNVRTENITKNIDELAESIKTTGLQQPPIVFPKKDGRYELIIGQRRIVAMKRLGLEKIPVLVRKEMNLTEARIASLSENVHRVKLSHKDMIDVCTYLLNKLGSVNKVAKAIGVNPQTVKEYLGLRIVPEPILKLVEKKKLPKGVAKRIVISMPGEERAIEMAKRVAKMTPSERDRTLDVVRENPEIAQEPVKKIVKEAEKRKIRKMIVIHLAEDLIKGIDEAADDLELDREMTIETAISHWLDEKGYL